MPEQPRQDRGRLLDAALMLLGRGILPVPVLYRSKKPFNADHPEGKEWEKLRISRETAAHYFNGDRQNIGALLGPPWPIVISTAPRR